MKHKRKSYAAAQGFTLIEIMIAMTLGSVLLFVSGQIMIHAAKTNRLAQQQNLIQESATVAKFFLERDIHRAGYYGGLKEGDSISGSGKVNAFEKICEGGDEDFALMLFPKIFSLNNARKEYRCLENYVANTDILTLRYLLPIKEIDNNSNKRHKLYMRVSANQGRVFKAKDEKHYSNQSIEKSADLFEVKTYIYYVRKTGRKCNGEESSGLYREYNNNKGFMEAEEIVSGVEQIQYRFLVNGDLKNADQIADDEWSLVEMVSVSLLLRADCAENFPSNGKAFLLQDFEFHLNTKKSFLRQTFHFDIALRN